MKKIYLLTVLGSLMVGTVSAQSKADGIDQIPLKHKLKSRIDNQSESTSRGLGGAIWSDDMSDPNTWVADYDPTTCDIMWEVGPGVSVQGALSAPYGDIQSTTASNGFAMIDSDFYGGASAGTCVEDSWIQTADSIDLSNYDRVVLEFETWYRRYNYEKPYVVISTDGVTWPELTPDTDISGMPNVFDIWPDFPDVTSLDNNPTLVRLNISEVAGNQPKVWIRFHWTGTWGYAWFVDDVRVVEQPANDLVAESAFMTHNGSGDEYGRIPQSQLLSTLNVGGEFLNFGFDDQNNVTADFDISTNGNSVTSVSSNYTLAMADSSYTMDEIATPPAQLEVGLYECSLVVESDEEAMGAGTFGNNTYLRNFEVTTDRYSLDGLGNHPAGYENTGILSTASFQDAADGFMLFTYYDISQEVAIMGLEVVIDDGTVPGGTIIGSIHDTTDVFLDEVNSPFEESDIVDVTQEHVDAGVITIMFEEPFVAEPNGFFAGIEMFSNDNENDIRVIDDLTVPQPAVSSMIYTPDDQTVYSNGNAAAIRLITADNVSVGELGKLEGVNVFPNPSNGIVSVRFTENRNYTIEVFNVLGKSVHSKVVNANTDLDLSALSAGAYMLAVTAENARFNERLILE
jgi:hypothetical protein